MTELVKQLPELKKKILTQKQLQLNNFKLGVTGESLACKYLLKKKYKILAKNIRFKNNEIDIVATDLKNSELVFIEVKTRSSANFGLPSEAVDYKKLRSMQRTATAYLKSNQKTLKRLGCEDSFRFDIITILYFDVDTGANHAKVSTKHKIQHFENITWP